MCRVCICLSFRRFTSWRTNSPSSWRSLVQDRTEQWSPVSIQIHRSRRLLASSSNWGCSAGTPTVTKKMISSIFSSSFPRSIVWCGKRLVETAMRPTYFVVILHELYYDSNIIGIIFDRNHSHYISRIFGVGVLAVLVCQHQTCICLVDLQYDDQWDLVSFGNFTHYLELEIYLPESQESLTFTRCRSIGFITLPWKNSTVVKCLFIRPSSSRSGGFLKRWKTLISCSVQSNSFDDSTKNQKVTSNKLRFVAPYRCKKTTSTSTSSLSSCRKSFRKCDTDSYVMWPQTTMCLLLPGNSWERRLIQENGRRYKRFADATRVDVTTKYATKNEAFSCIQGVAEEVQEVGIEWNMLVLRIEWLYIEFSR